MRQYFAACMGFGATMGVVFPPFAYLFVDKPVGTPRLLFLISCILAGLAVGVMAYVLGKKLVLEFLQEPITKIQNLFEEDEGTCRDDRETDPLVCMRLDLEQTYEHIVDSARMALDAESRMKEFSSRFAPTLKSIEDGARDNLALAGRTGDELKAYEDCIRNAVTVFTRQDKITDAVLEGIAAVRAVLSSLAEEIRGASTENERTTKEILSESDRFLGALSALTDAAALIGDVGRDIRGLADLVSGTADEIREIGDISERTQVLAINANVEASRAGDESGRGFRVIAGNVSELADRSRTVSGEILSNLSRMEGTSRHIAETADGRETALSAYKDQAGGAQSARQKISDDMAKSRELDSRVLGALNAQEEQMHKLLEIAAEMNENEANLMSNIASLKDGFAGLLDRGGEMMSISRNQETAAADIRRIYEGMNSLARRTSEMSGRFKIRS